MKLEQLDQANLYRDGMKKAERIKKLISSLIYNAEKGDGININLLFENINDEDNHFFQNLKLACGLSYTDDEIFESFFLQNKDATPQTKVDIDILRYMMAAMDKANEHFLKKIEEI